MVNRVGDRSKVPACLPVLVFDGDCAFCSTCARFLQRWVVSDGSTSVEPWQRLDLAELGLTTDQCRAAVQWVGQGHGLGGGQAAGEQMASGHAAVAATLRAGHPGWRPVGALLVAPGFSWLARGVYSWVAAHRDVLPGGTPACRTP